MENGTILPIHLLEPPHNICKCHLYWLRALSPSSVAAPAVHADTELLLVMWDCPITGRYLLQKLPPFVSWLTSSPSHLSIVYTWLMLVVKDGTIPNNLHVGRRVAAWKWSRNANRIVSESKDSLLTILACTDLPMWSVEPITTMRVDVVWWYSNLQRKNKPVNKQ